MADYDGASETERVLVNYEGLAILSLLKIQSNPDSKGQVIWHFKLQLECKEKCHVSKIIWR